MNLPNVLNWFIFDSVMPYMRMKADGMLMAPPREMTAETRKPVTVTPFASGGVPVSSGANFAPFR
jgi:hypothetical protein